MKHIELLNKFRKEIAELVVEVESSVAMGHLDINRICEDVFCGLFAELYGFSYLRNLNNDDKKNFPGIDLADERARVAIQVTSDNSLDKIKSTVRAIKDHKLHDKFDQFFIYVLTKRQATYSQIAIDKICGDVFDFSVRNNVLDQRDISTKAASASPVKLQAALNHLLGYRRGVGVGLGDEDFDPPAEPSETIGTNLVEIYFPTDLYIAEVISDAITTEKGKKVRNQRKRIREYASDNLGKTLPSDFEALGGRIITFHNLEENRHPFSDLIEDGTVERFSPQDFYSIDNDHERVFKSLLRFLLQQKLYPHRVIWQHFEHKFIFLPMRDEDDKRSESWTGQRTSSRMVFERKYNRNNPEKILSTRHFAFNVEFVRVDDSWFISLTPDWLFSYGPKYYRSHFGEKLLSGLKRMEKNRSVYDQVRFLASWLEAVDREDLFSSEGSLNPTMSFGALLVAEGGRQLNEALWASLEVPDEDLIQERLGIN